MKRKEKPKMENEIWALGERSSPLNLRDSLKIRDGLNNSSMDEFLYSPESRFSSKFHSSRLKTFSLN